MHVLIVGAGGFIGGHIAGSVLADGHRVTCAGRDMHRLQQRFPQATCVTADFSSDHAADWAPRLAGVDAVINAVGVLRGNTEQLHHHGPAALFQACAVAGIAHVLQISALGAGTHDWSPFLASKARADQIMQDLARDHNLRGWCVLRPSLVIGRGGQSTALFSALAALPCPVGLGGGDWRVQPIHVRDVVRIVTHCLTQPVLPLVLDLVGADPMTTDALTTDLRRWLGLPDRPFIHLPFLALRVVAAAARYMPKAALTMESLRLLQAGNTASSARFGAALGTASPAPLPLATSLALEPASRADLWHARLLPWRVLARAALAVMWIGSGIASFCVTPAQSNVLLHGLALSGTSAYAVSMAGAAWDTLLGLALLFQRVRIVAAVQLATMAFYTVLASIALPALWMDPFGSLLKNVAVLAATLLLAAIED